MECWCYNNIQCHFQIYKDLHIKIVVLCIETWIRIDLYGNFSSDPGETLELFLNYTIYYVLESYDAIILIT